MALYNMFVLSLFFALLGVLVAAPLQAPEPIDPTQPCTSRCVTSNLQKKGLFPGHTYHFSYNGSSYVELDETSPTVSTKLELQADVKIQLGDSCDVQIDITNPKVNGVSDALVTKLLSEKRMLARYKEGLFHQVCADPEDHPSGLNLKKGILSTVQNLLVEVVPGQKHSILELDVLGLCPTEYSTTDDGQHYVVTKSKDHKNCKQEFPTADESPVTSWWLRSSLLSIISESQSECRQVFDKDTLELKEANCKDVKKVKSPYGKNVKTIQEHKIKLVRTEPSTIISPLPVNRVVDLRFEVIPKPKTKDIIPTVKQHMKELCESVEDKLKEDSAERFEVLISYLKNVPKESIHELLEAIKSKEFCQNYERLEILFYDALPYIDNAGAVEIMVDQVVSKKVSGIRASIYTLALHLIKKPCIHSVKAVSPLFDSKDAPKSMVLAAGNLVRKYCKFHADCSKEEPVKEILQKLSKEIDSTCSSTMDSQEKKVEALTALKAVGNIAKLPLQLEKSIQKCLESKQAEAFVRVAAAQAYRRASCKSQPTKEMMDLTVRSDEETEVRIASYVAAIRCASFEQTKLLLEKIEKEHNTQVRSFVLSNLRNLQKSDAPYLVGQRYNLTTLLIPTDYSKNLKKYSRDVDISYYFPTLEFGAGLQSSVIYIPGSYVPRQIQANFTADLFDNVINIGEISIRLEYIDAIVHAIFGPGGVLESSKHGHLAGEIIKQLREKSPEINEHIGRYLRRSGRKEDISKLSNIFSALNIEGVDSKDPKIDALLRIFGQEIAFASLSVDMKKITPDGILDSVLQFIDRRLLDLENITSSFTNGGQIRADYMIPTAQGIPLQLKAVLTGITSFDVRNSVKIPKNYTDYTPVATIALNAFAGFSFGAKTGIRMRFQSLESPQVKSSLQLIDKTTEFKLDIPERVKVFDIKYQCYTMTKMPGHEDVRKYPQPGSYPVKNFTQCWNETGFGVDTCMHMTTPDENEIDIPLGDMLFYVDVKKNQPDKELLKLTTTSEWEESKKSLDYKLEAPGALNPQVGEFLVEYQENSDTKSLKVFVKGQSLKGRSVQVSMKSKKTSAASLHSYVLFLGEQMQVSSADQAVVLKMKEGKKNDGEMHHEVSLTTKKKVEHYVKVKFEVDVVIKETSPVQRTLDLRHLDAQLVIPKKLNSTSYIKLDSPESPVRNYSIYSKTDDFSKDLLKVTGFYQTEGDMEHLDHKCHAKLAMKVLKAKRDWESRMIWIQEKKQIFGSLKDPKKSHPDFLVDASLIRDSSGQKISTSAELKAPPLINGYKIEGSIEQEGSGKSQIHLVAKEEDQVIYKLDGPFSLEVTQSNFRESSELKFTSVKETVEYLLKTRLDLSEQKKDVLVDLKINSEPSFTVELELDEEGDQVTSSVGLVIPKIVDAKIKAERSSTLLQMVLNGYLEPNTEDSKKIQGSSSIDLQQKEVKAKLEYDLEKDPNKEVGMSARYDYDLKQKYVSVKGDMYVHKKVYRYAAESVLGAYSSEASPKGNTLKIRVVRPDGQEFKLESECSSDKKTPMTSVSYKLLVQTDKDHVHKISNDYSYQLFTRRVKIVKIKGETVIESPAVKKITIGIKTKLDVSDVAQKGQFKVDVDGERLHKPIHTNIEFDSDDKKLMAKALVDLGLSSSMRIDALTQMSKSEDRSIRDASVDLTVDLSKEKSYKLSAHGSKERVTLDLTVNGQIILALEQSSRGDNTFTAKLTTPLRKAEVHSRITEDSAALSVYPNRMRSEDKYEVGGHYRHTQSTIDAEARLKYPGIDKDMKVLSKIDMIGETHGAIILDIFKSPEDKVTIDVTRLRTRGGGFKVSGTITVPNQKYIYPEFEVHLDLSNRTKHFEVEVRNVSNERPSFSYIMKASKATEKSWVLYSQLKTPSDTIEMVSELRRHELLQCIGKTVNGTIVSRKHGEFDFHSAVCAPGYIEVGAKRASRDKIYMMKLGMKRPDAIKVAVDLVFNSTDAETSEMEVVQNTFNLYGTREYLPKVPILLVGAKLWAPTVVTLEAYYDSVGIKEYVERFVKPAAQKLQDVYDDVIKQIPKEFKDSMLPGLTEVADELTEALGNLKEKVSEEVKAIAKEMGITSESIDKLKEEIVDAVEKMSAEVYEVIGGLDKILQNILGFSFSDIQKAAMELDIKLQEKTVSFMKDIEKFFQDVLQDPEPMMRSMLGGSIWDWIKEKVNNFKNKIKQEWRQLSKLFSRWEHAIKRTFRNLYRKITHIPIVHKVVKWIESWFEDPDDSDLKSGRASLVGSVFSEFYSAHMTPQSCLFRLQVPLRTPVSSLKAAMSSVGVSVNPSKHILRDIGAHSSAIDYMERSSSHSHPASAKVERGILVTFDGLSMPVIHSDCELLLAKVFDDKLSAILKDEKKMEVKIHLKSGKEVKIHLEHGKPIRSPLLKEKKSLKTHGMEMKKISESKIEIELKGLKIILEQDKLEVKAKPWAYSKVQGLMGNHDNEISNDARQGAESIYKPRSHESQHSLTKKSAREIMEMYKTSKSCQIPHQ